MNGRTCVIYNPAAGRGRAETQLQELRSTLGADLELRPSQAPGHAEELARAAVEEGFGKVVAAGGDGTVHEVANGVLQTGRRDVVFSTWPLGSANDYAYTLGLTAWWQKRLEGLPTETMDADVGIIRSGERQRYFVNSLGLGFNGMVTVEARKIRWLRGLPLYMLAFLKSIVKHFVTPRMALQFDELVRDGPTLALTVNLGQREGGFPLTPRASLTDGMFDYMHATGLRRWQLIRYLPAMAMGALPKNHPLIALGQCRKLGVQSTAPLCVHADGELFCVTADGISNLELEVEPARLKVEIYRPGLYGSRPS